ncbi:MAG: YihY/virulence factor BrkB family protein [Rikenellaceae bacterium]|nr:YihY/virulence factor BrkB family protein [Rikenellaceae bacterium]
MSKWFNIFGRHSEGGKRAAMSTHGANLPRGVKLIIYTIRGVDRHQTMVRSAALSFYTVLSLVPILALVFAIFKGFGMDAGFINELHTRFPEYTDLLDTLLEFAENILARTRGGVVAIGGVIFLIWAVAQVFGGVESAFNAIWEVKRRRSLARSVTDYIAVIFIVPVLLLLLNGALVETKAAFAELVGAFVAEVVYLPTSLLGVWICVLLLYYLLPNTKVHFRPSAIAALVASVVFLIFQEGYFYIQHALNTYNAIYGTFAAVPLLLVFVQASWMILLLGGELSYAIQNVRNFERDEESMHIGPGNRKRIAVAVMAVVARRYTASPMTTTSAEDIASELELPIRIVSDVLFELETARFVMAVAGADDTKRTGYLPARDVHSLSIADVTHGLNRYDDDSIDLERNQLLQNVGDRFNKIEAIVAASPVNAKIMDLL